MKEKVVIAMSGGVDSSVAAALLKEQGYDVIGITMQVLPSNKLKTGFGGCCSIDAIENAKKVAKRLDFPHYVLNFRKIFEEKVIKNFCEEYSKGRTPNPCVQCNTYTKFDDLLGRSREIGAKYLATGHYVKINFNKKENRFVLKKAKDLSKDQSYALYNLTQEKLKYALFPLGNLFKKKEVRIIARELGLPNADVPDSQEICFIPDNDYCKFLKELIPSSIKPGNILNTNGEIIGTHKGLQFYTIGQRKGLGINSKKPLYVVKIIPGQNTIVVGYEKDTYSDELTVDSLNWVSISNLDKPQMLDVKVRYTAIPARAKVFPETDNTVKVKFVKKQRAITPGQSAVFYHKDVLLGGGVICSNSF
ncbi:MAG: tRNA 2-thiouridine(34) synthase MnmA [Candidatus Firestonebacteria bacterium]